MSDRFVRQVDPRPTTETAMPRRMSDYAPMANIILVGDPGSGKSHLFGELARAEKAKVRSAREFLNTPSEQLGQVLFIDALDERREGRRDRTTIDEIVRKLFIVKASRVRLACREHDWLGGTDIEAFRPYFSQYGGCVVLALERLSEVEQVDILAKNGVLDPYQFIREAERRGLPESLGNPQNLIMLAKFVLEKKSWPATRRQLFEETSILLLQEHNSAHIKSGRGGQFGASEIRTPASAICALRLISDVEGVSLIDADIDPSYPSYRSIPFAPTNQILASLGRRAFRSLGGELVNYSHRVLAEYLAAGWLAQAIGKGLPIKRLQALIGVDDVPAPGLRGMYAWLPVFLPHHSNELIGADPLGILIYGDANSLNLAQRICLLKALSRLAASEPYFRSEEPIAVAVSALCRLDMVPHLRDVLTDATAPFGIKNFVLNCLRIAPPLVDLEKEIVAVVADPKILYGLKWPALRAAKQLTESASKAVLKIYRGLGETADAIRLRGDILAMFYVGGFSPNDVLDLYCAATRCSEELLVGVLWSISKSLPISDVPLVLDSIAASDCSQIALKRRRNRFECGSFIERLVIRSIEERAEGVSGARLWSWLEACSSISERYSESDAKDIKSVLAGYPDMVRATFDAALENYQAKSSLWRYAQKVRAYLPFLDEDDPLRWLSERLFVGEDTPAKRDAFYELAFSWVYVSPKSTQIFEFLYELAERFPEMKPLRSRLVASGVETWRVEDKARLAEELEQRDAERLRNSRQFTKDIHLIRSGAHIGWMSWAAYVYFGIFDGIEAGQSHRERLQAELGIENSVAALDGLKAFIRTCQLPSLQDLVVAISQNSYPRVWYAFLGGMDELWLETPSLDGFSDERLKVLIGIDLILPTSLRNVQGIERDARKWKEQAFVTKIALVKDVYLYLAEACLKNDGQRAEGFYELLNEASFAPFRGEIAGHLLETSANLPPSRLEELLRVALVETPRSLVKELVRRRLEAGSESVKLWVLAAYLIDPDTYQNVFEEHAKDAPSLVWHMRALTSYDRGNRGSPYFVTSSLQRETLARLVARHFPNTGYSTSASWGDENSWNASDYVRNLLDALSADDSADATKALERLECDPAMETYLDSVKHALANQRARYREKSYRQPNWTEAISTLAGGRPANVADLQALVVDYLREISARLGTQNTNIYKQFWNEDSYSRPEHPKTEESARSVLLGLLKVRLDPLDVIIDPEGHMVADKRADIVAALPGRKLVIEFKRDSHEELWSAPIAQLDRFYTRDPDASGYGIFGVFWYGKHRKGYLPKHPNGKPSPKTAQELEAMLSDIIVAEQRSKLSVVVIDVSVPDGQKVGTGKGEQKKAKAPKVTPRRRHVGEKSAGKSDNGQIQKRKGGRKSSKSSKVRTARVARKRVSPR